MVDSIKNVPLYQNIYTIVSMVLGGYYDTEYVEWGPYYKLLSFNKQEGCRFQLGARTTTDFSKKIRLFRLRSLWNEGSSLERSRWIRLFLQRFTDFEVIGCFQTRCRAAGSGNQCVYRRKYPEFNLFERG